MSVRCGIVLVMTYRFDTARRDAFAERVRRWPVTAFDAEGADGCVTDRTAEEGGSANGLPLLFGPETSVQPHVYCEDLGAWQNGNTALVVLPAEVGGGVAGLFFDEYREARRWHEMGLGRRIEAVLSLTREARVHESIPALALALADRVADTLADVPEEDVVAVTLNGWGEVWLLRHCLEVLEDDDKAALLTVLALRPGWDCVRAVVERAGRLVANLPFDDDIEDVVREAVVRHNGVSLNGRQIERLGVGEEMLGAPREDWAQVADRLVALRYADGLDATYHPEPAHPKPGKGGRAETAGARNVIIAA